jgi:hypothetical protein
MRIEKKLGVVLLLLRGLPCFGQQGTTAELTGRVASAGQALPGVTVTLTSDALQGSRVTVTGENGGYLFALLPPADYLLRFDLQGFTAVERRVRVPLAVTTRADVELEATPFHETVTVESGSAPVAASASIGTNLRAAELQRLPGGRDIRAAVLLSPSASAQGPTNRLVIAGAPTWDSLFLVDGVVVNEYLSGQPHSLFIEDAIQEIAVLIGAVSAEYGRFTGGVVSTLTKSGGNEFRGSLRDTLTNGAWTKRTPWAGQPDPLDKVNNAVEGTLGGFLLKDRLWFFAAGRKAEASLDRFTALTDIAYRVDSREERWDVKVTQQITGRHSLVASYIDTSLAETNAIDPDRGGRVADLASLIPKRLQPARLLALTYEGLLAQNTFAEIHGSRKRYALLGNGGGSADPVLGTVIVVRSQGVNLNAPIGCGVCGPDKRDSSSWAAKSSHYGNTRWGNHTTVVGAEWFHEQRINSGTRSASEFNIQEIKPARIVDMSAFPVFDATTSINWTKPIAGSRGTDQNTWSAYLNDRWDLSSRLGVNLGVRYDRNNVRDAVGRVVSDDDAYSPRVGATFDLLNDGRHRLIAGYGRYTAKILAGGGDPQQVGVFRELAWRYHGPEINGEGTPVDQLLPAPEALARLFAWFDSVGGVENRQYLFYFTDPRYTSEFRRPLKSPAVDEWSLGYAMQLLRGYLRADYVARDWRHFYAARVDTTTGQKIGPIGNKLDLAWIINDDSETVRTYRAIQLQGSWRYRRVTAGGGYTWSTLRGNDDEDDGSTNGPRNKPLRLYYPEFLVYPQRRPIGYLLQDQRHRARLWVGYERALPRGSISAFLLQWFDSGRPYSAVANIDPTRTVPSGIPANFGYALNQVHMGAYFFSKRGAFRTDDVFSTDLAVNYEIPYRSWRLFFKGDVLNLFNNAAVVSPGTVVITGFAASGLRTFNPFTEVPVEGVNYRLASNFGKPTGPESYQTPRTFQLSFGARF